MEVGSELARPDAAPRPLRRLLPLAIVLAVAAAFSPVLQAEFVNYDDPENLTRNFGFRGLAARNLEWMLRTGRMGHFQPLSWLSLGLDFELWGRADGGLLDPFGFHATNLVLHALTASLVYMLAGRLLSCGGHGGSTSSALAAAFAALAFALHPLRAESVAWVTERRDVLSAPFFVLSVLAWLRWGVEVPASRLRPRALLLAALAAAGSTGLFFASVDLSSPGQLRAGPAGIAGLVAALGLWSVAVALISNSAARGPSGPARRWVVLCAAALLLSLLAKAWGMVMPVLLLVVDAWPLRRARGSASALRAWGRLVLEKAPLFALTVVFAALAVWAQAGQADTLKGWAEHTLAERLAQGGYGLAFYPLRTLWPSGLAPIYDLPAALSFAQARFLVPALGVLALTAALVAARRRAPAALAAWCAYVVVVSPVLGVLQSGPQLVADRYSYLSGVPFALLAGAALERGLDRGGRTRAAALALAVGSIAVLGVLCARQATIWRDSKTLWEHTLRVHPGSAMAHLSLGTVRHLEAGAERDPARKRALLAEAMTLFQRGMELDPQPRHLANMALVEGTLAEIDPDGAPAHRALALEYSERALALAQERGGVDPELRLNHAVHLFNAGRVQEALPIFQWFVKVKPGSVLGRYRYAVALMGAGRPAEAALQLERVLALEPGHSDARKLLEAARAMTRG